ncbi:MAG TPA: RDD family protein [Candidatus Dormibacteraeota bacterium]
MSTSSPDFDAYREYTDWYVWAKRNLSIESSVCHAAAAAATAVTESGGTREQAIEAARRSFTSGGHAQADAGDLRRRTYAEWFDWARRELGGLREQQHAAAAAALRTLDQGLGANVAMNHARAASGAGPPEPPSMPPPPAAAGPGPTPYAPAPMPPPPPPPPYYAPGAPYVPPGYAYYGPPAALPAQSSPYAGFWRRLAAFLLDTVIGVGVWAAVVFLITFVLLALLLATGSTLDNYSSRVPGWISFAYYALGVVMTWLYFTLLEASAWQATVGKHALGLRVTNAAGARLSWLRANARYWAKLLSFLMLGIGFLMIVFTERKQALHDLIAGTLVSRRPPS